MGIYGSRSARRIISIAVCLSAIGGTMGCALTDSGGDHAVTVDRAGCRPETSGDSQSVTRGTRSVLAVSIDGLTPAAVRSLGPARAPTLHRLVRHGATTMNARTTVEETRTLPNHTTMFTGRRVNAWRGGHGVDVNTDPGGTVHDRADEHVSSMFSIAARGGGRPALFVSKAKFGLFQRTWRCAIVRFTYRSDNERLTSLVRRDLKRRDRGLRFVHYSAADSAGHEHGFDSARYRDAVADTDRHLGRLIRQIRTVPRLRGQVTVIVTSDHGGTAHDHSNPRVHANYTIPFLAWGAGVSRGADLYALNPDRRRPGGVRARYGGRQPVRNGDLANLALDILGLRPIPGSQINTRQTLDLSRK